MSGGDWETRIPGWLWPKKKTKIKWNDRVSEKNFIALKQKNFNDEINNFFMHSYYSKNWDLREAHDKSLNEMKELKKLQSSTFDTIARRRLVEDQDTILELTGKIQDLQNEINCMNDSRDFQDAESVRSGNSHLIQFLEGMLSRSIGLPNRREGPPSITNTHGFSGNVFVNPVASSSALYPQELNAWSSGREEPIHSSTVEKSEKQTPVKIWDASLDREPKVQSSSVEETLQRIMGQTNSDCRFQIFILTSSLHQQHLLVWRWDSRLRYVLVHNFLRKLCIGSKKWSWLIQWMNWDLRHLLVVFQCRILKCLMRGLLQHWTKSSIIPSSKGESVWRNKRPRSRTVSFRGRQIAYLIYEYFRVTGSHDSVENYTDLFTIVLRNDDIQEFDSKWDGISLSMTKIPHDDILEGLYKLRIRVSEKLKTVSELYNMEIHQKKNGPDYHR